AAGLPIVATRVGGNAEVVHDGETGFLVPAGEPEPMAAAVVRLLQDRGLRASLGAKGLEVHRREVTLEAMVDRYAHLYRSLLGRRGPLAASQAHVPESSVSQLIGGRT